MTSTCVVIPYHLPSGPNVQIPGVQGYRSLAQMGQVLFCFVFKEIPLVLVLCVYVCTRTRKTGKLPNKDSIEPINLIAFFFSDLQIACSTSAGTDFNL